MPDPLMIFSIGTIGALISEVFRIYEMMGKLDQKKFEQILSSKIYYLVVVSMSLGSGFVALIINSGLDTTHGTSWPLQVMLSGIGARAIVYQGLQAKVSNEDIRLGKERKITFKDIFK